MPKLSIRPRRPSFRSAAWGFARMGCAAAAALLLATAPGCGGRKGGGAAAAGPEPAPAPVLPEIQSLQAERETITLGESTNLSFTFTGGSATLEPGIGAVTSGSTVKVEPAQDTAYTLTVKGADNAEVHRVLTVKVAPVPVPPAMVAPAQVAAFQTGLVAKVDPAPGSTYLWTVTNGTITSGEKESTVTFDAGSAGDLTVQCVVTNAAGKAAQPVVATVAVKVSSITGFKAEPAQVTSGAATSLLATFSGGTGRIEPGNLPVTSGTPVTVHPLADTTYTLTLSSGTNAVVSAQAVVSVVPAPVDTPIRLQGGVQAGLSGYQASVNPQAGCSYHWRIANGTLTAGADTPTVTFSAGAPGPMTLECRVTNLAGTSIDLTPLAVTVQDAPAPGALVVNLPQPVFPAFKAGLHAEVAPEAGASYAWTLSDGAINLGAGTNAIQFTSGGPAPATVTCTMTLANGSTRTGSATFTPSYPVIDLFQPGMSYVTVGGTTSLDFSFSGGAGIITPGAIPVTSGGRITVAPGIYTLTVTDAAGNVDRQERTVTAVPRPTIASFKVDQPIIGPGREANLTPVFDAGPHGTVEIGGLGAATSGAPTSTGPLTTSTTYTLRVTNAGGETVTRDVTVRVATLQLLAGVPSGEGNGDGVGSLARFKNPSGMAQDAAGNLYVADKDNHLIRKIGADGTVTTLAGNAGVRGMADGQGRAATFNSPHALAVDAQGKVYVADLGNNAIRMILPDGTVSTVEDAPGHALAFNGPKGIAVNPAGTQVFVSDTGDRTIKVFDPTAGVIAADVIAGQSRVTGFADGPGGVASFRSPEGLARGGDGVLYVADSDSVTIRRITYVGAGYIVERIAGRDQINTFGTVIDGPGLTVATFGRPNNIAVDSLNNLYVTDDRYKSVRKLTFTAPGYVVSTLAGSTTVMGNQDGNPLTVARFIQPTGLVVNNATGTVFVADAYAAGAGAPRANTIRVIPATSNTLTLAGAIPGPGRADGTLAQARFRDPRGSAVDGAGNIYVVDAGNNTIRKIATDGTVSTLAGDATAGPGAADGVTTAARFNGPRGIAVDANGILYVTDTGNHTIRRIAQDGTVTTLAGAAGASGFANGMGAAAQFNTPLGIAVDPAGNLYVADRNNHQVRKIDTTLAVTTLAGDSGRDDTMDGAFAVGAISAPAGLALDPYGKLLVTDVAHNTIRTVRLADGYLDTLAGDAGSPGRRTLPGYVDADGGLARFARPYMVASDAFGAYVADLNNNAVRMVAPDGVVTTVLGISGFPLQRGVQPGASLPTPFSVPTGVSVDPVTGNILVSTEDAIMKVVFQ